MKAPILRFNPKRPPARQTVSHTAPLATFDPEWREMSVEDKVRMLATLRPTFLEVIGYACDSMLERIEHEGVKGRTL